MLIYISVCISWLRADLIKKLVEALNNGLKSLATGQFGARILTKSKGELRRLADGFDTLSKQLEETANRQSGYIKELIEELKEDKRFHNLLSQMILDCESFFSEKEVYFNLNRFLSRSFKQDSGLVLVKISPGEFKPVVVWGQFPSQVSLPYYECTAFVQAQIHTGPSCNPACRQLCETTQDRICVPLSMQGEEVLGLLTIMLSVDSVGARNMAMKRRWAIILAQHISHVLNKLKRDQQLYDLALRDPLTGLYNRRFLEEALQREILVAERHGRYLAVIMIDLDHFKKFNDVYGHLAGDALLREFGLLLLRRVRAGDAACRYGGDEFTLILSEMNIKSCLKRVEELRVAIGGLRIWQIYQWLPSQTVSIGVAVYPDHGTTKEMLLKAADLALYQAKEMGRNRVCVAAQEEVPAVTPKSRLTPLPMERVGPDQEYLLNVHHKACMRYKEIPS